MVLNCFLRGNRIEMHGNARHETYANYVVLNYVWSSTVTSYDQYLMPVRYRHYEYLSRRKCYNIFGLYRVKILGYTVNDGRFSFHRKSV